MAQSEYSLHFQSLYGVIYRPYLRDGEDFTGRVKRAAREMAEEQDERDEELFAVFGGFEKVRRRLLAKIEDESQSLARLNSAEDRAFMIHGLETARLAPASIVRINDLIGYGLVAARKIRANDYIGEYTGVLRRTVPGDQNNHYLAGTKAYGDCEDFLIDGQSEGNITRFINHCSNAPNVRSDHVFHDHRWHRVLRANRDITAGEQFLWNYGVDYWRLRELPAQL